jgi:hypothetical protein
MMDRATDYGAGTVAATAPAWVPLLSNLNTILTTASLVVGIAFVLWRWRRALRRGDE